MAQKKSNHSAAPKNRKQPKKITAKQRIAVNAKRCVVKPVKVSGGRGRPSGYLPKFCDEIIAFMGAGFSLAAFAGNIGVSRETIYAWTESHKDFSDALTKARAARTLYWERRLQMAGPDARAVIFALRNSCADEWKQNPDETASVNVTVNNDVQVDTTQPPEKWGAAELEAELRRMGVPVVTSRTNGNGHSARGDEPSPPRTAGQRPNDKGA